MLRTLTHLSHTGCPQRNNKGICAFLLSIPFRNVISVTTILTKTSLKHQLLKLQIISCHSIQYYWLPSENCGTTQDTLHEKYICDVSSTHADHSYLRIHPSNITSKYSFYKLKKPHNRAAKRAEVYTRTASPRDSGLHGILT